MPDPAANAPETEAKKSRGLGSYVLWGFAVVMVYVLSSGPVMLLTSKGVINNGVFTFVYRPLVDAYFKTRLHRPLGMYWHLWCPARYDSDGNH